MPLLRFWGVKRGTVSVFGVEAEGQVLWPEEVLAGAGSRWRKWEQPPGAEEQGTVMMNSWESTQLGDIQRSLGRRLQFLEVHRWQAQTAFLGIEREGGPPFPSPERERICSWRSIYAKVLRSEEKDKGGIKEGSDIVFFVYISISWVYYKHPLVF